VNARRPPTDEKLRADAVVPFKVLAEHASTDDCWIALDGKVYDVTSYTSRHPGGRRIAILAGEDATSMVLGGHPPSVRTMLASLQVGSLEEIVDAARRPVVTPFLKELDAAVRKSLVRLEARPVRWDLWATLVLWVCAWTGAYVLGYYGLGVVMGLCSCALVGMLAHEHAHGSLAPDPERSLGGRCVAGLVWPALFPSMSQPHFYHEHFRHHEAPMDANLDFEVAALAPFLRLSADVPWRPRHRWLVYFAPLFYGSYITIQFFSGFLTSYFAKRRLARDAAWRFEIMGAPFVSLSVHVLLPLWLVGSWRWGIGFLLFNVSWQAATYLIAAVPHMTDHRLPTEAKTWPEWVCRTTINLHAGPFSRWLAGGFDFQIEHHLLPWVPRHALAHIAPLVQRSCQEHGFPYRVYTSFWSYVRDHLAMLRHLAQPPSL
jgi:fatty acid desaturase/predicted heme/steroid binding protein